jgi:methylphosphotriester-DNA--protein-cysteine methyltransferase
MSLPSMTRIGNFGGGTSVNRTIMYRSPLLAGRGIHSLQYHWHAQPDLAYRRLPLPWATIIITLGSAGRWRRPGFGWNAFPRIAVRGHADAWTEGADDPSAACEYIAVLLEPWAVEPILGVPARLVRAQVLDLRDLIGSPADVLLEEVAKAECAHAKLRFVARWLTLRDERRCDLRAADFIRLCRANAGSGSVGRLGSRIGLSDRQLRAVFREAIGCSPKTWARLERFAAFLRELHPSAFQAADHLNGAEYFDQAHAIKEFQRHAGITPRAYVREKATGDPRVFMVRALA